MSAVRELTILLIKAGVDPVEATILIARAGVEMTPPGDTRSAGAKRQSAYRERNKASLNITKVTHEKVTESVTKRNETSLSDASSLSIESKKEENKKKRESAKASQLPAGWRPDLEVWNETIAILGAEQRAEYELKKFTDHALEKGRTAKNWNAAWRNWSRRAVEYGGRNGQSNPTIRTPSFAGPAPTGDDAIVTGMGRALERRRAARAADDPGRRAFRTDGGDGFASGDAPESGSTPGDGGSRCQLALVSLPNR